ncbi:tetratricopeptide repeat protein [Streptomyces sp. NPDC059755]|uniref:tetratricopeptide repeat protein n=1 Tax=Streptomyces sp. NPDC059755 TaxID=3346934 RepID=UPI003665835D
MVESEFDLTRTVIWINETQIFLGPGRLKSETIRRLFLNHERPVVLVGTIWPTEYDRLSSTPATPGDQDFDWESREILKLARRFTLKEFSNSEQERARELSWADPRIAEAVAPERDGARLTEFLSAAPELVERFEQAANPYGAALIGAGVEARLCGHPEPIPAELLEILAAAHLSGAQRAQAKADWLTDALQWSCQPVRGSAAPLVPYAARVGELDGYRVTDILVQHRQNTLPEIPIPDSQWALLIDFATPDACTQIGVAAYTQGHQSLAETAWRRAFDGGETEVAAPLGLVFYMAGQAEAARAWWGRALEVDGAPGAAVIGRWIYEYGRSLNEAREWWGRAVELGGSPTAISIGNALWRLENIDEARSWWERAIEVGDISVVGVIGENLYDHDIDEARLWFGRAVEKGDTGTVVAIGDALWKKENPIEARVWWEHAVQLGGSSAASTIGNHLYGSANVGEAHIWWERAAELGGAPTALGIGFHLFRGGNPEGARIWWERAIEAEGIVVAVLLGHQLAAQGAVEEARAWRTRAAEAGWPADQLEESPNQSEEA